MGRIKWPRIAPTTTATSFLIQGYILDILYTSNRRNLWNQPKGNLILRHSWTYYLRYISTRTHTEHCEYFSPGNMKCSHAYNASPQMSTSLTVCVRDYWKALHFHNRPKPEAGDSCSQTKKPLRRLTIEVDAINGNYYLREFLQQRVMGECLQTAHGVQLIWLEFRPPERDTIDYRFAHMLAHTLWEHIEVEHLMSWLSTLGGGFSALGEQFERCVGVPGKPTKPTGNALNFYSDTGGDRRQDIAAAAEDRPPARRSLPAGPLQAVLQHLPDPARTAKGGQASHPAAVRLCASQRGEGCAAGADVPRHLAPAGLRVRAAQDTEDGQLKRHSHTMIYR